LREAIFSSFLSGLTPIEIYYTNPLFTLNKFFKYLFFIIGFPTFLYGREVPKIIHFQRNDYQAAHQNWMITQDCEGFLFVANSDGVLIFNGFQWQKIPLPRNQEPRAVFHGEDCHIYVGGYECFGYIDMENRNEPKYVAVADSILKNTNQEIWNIFGSQQKMLFQSFSDLFQYDYQTIKKVDLPGNVVLGKVAAQRFYIPKVAQGLYEFDNEIREIAIANTLPVNSKIAALAEAPDVKDLLVGTQNHGLFLITENQVTPLDSEFNNLLKREQINKIVRLKNGDYTIGTILNGLYITSDLQTIKYHINQLNGLSNNTVLSLFEDKNNNLWVGMDKGLDLLMLSNPIDFYYDIQGKLGNVFTSIDYQNKLYLGTNQGAFVQGNDGEYQLIKNSQGQVWSFLEADGNLLCGHNTGTFQIKKEEFIKVSDVAGGWWMYPIGKHRILQATYNGLIVLKKENDAWVFEKKVKNGDLLMTNFLLQGNRLTGYHSNYGIAILKLSDDFSEVLETNIINKKDGVNFLDDVQLLNGDEEVFIRQNNHHFWVVADTLQKFNSAKWKTSISDQLKASLRFHSVKRKMIGVEGIFPSSFYRVSPDRTDYIFAIDKGYIRVPTSWTSTSHLSDNPSVDYVTINEEILLRDRNKFVEKLELTSTENDLTVYLKTSSDMCVAQTNFEYMLQGWDDRRHLVPKDGVIKFYNLKGGDYRLLIISAMNAPGFPNLDSSSELLQFSIQPHWYESWIGGILYSGIILLLILFLNFRQKRKLKKQALKLKAEKEKELESERIRSKNKTLEQELLYKSKMLANSTMTLIQKNKMLNQVKDFIQEEANSGSVKGLKKQKIFNLIDRNINSDQDWEIFEKNFAAVHRDFLDTLQANFPDMTAGELRLAAYIRLNLSSKEISPLLNISLRSVENKRYRLRKRMNVSKEDSLKDYLMRL
jgi:ligand-binding sensor domain-containing protein/DNA-binding CsgD family transcriptional regulator